MIVGYTGHPGSGKTYNMVCDAQRYVGKRDIYANFVVPWAEFMPDISQIVGCTNALVLIDEAGIWFNARSYKESMTKEALFFFSQHRKQGADIWFTAQYPEMVDSHIRRMVFHWYVCARFIGRLFYIRGVDGWEGRTFSRKFRWLSEKVCALYDTFELVGQGDGTGAGRGAAAQAEAEKVMNSHLVREDHGGRVIYRAPTVHEVLTGVPMIERKTVGRTW